MAEEFARAENYQMLEDKRNRRKADEEQKPLEEYRNEELKRMWENFFGADRSYHLARQRFVYKCQAVQLQK